MEYVLKTTGLSKSYKHFKVYGFFTLFLTAILTFLL